MQKKKTTFSSLEIGDRFYFEYELGIVKLYREEHIVDDNLKYLGTFEKIGTKSYKLIGLTPIYSDRKIRKVPIQTGVCVPNTQIVLA